MMKTVFPYDARGDFVYSAKELLQTTSPMMVTSQYPLYGNMSFTMPAIRTSFSFVVGHIHQHGENSLATKSETVQIFHVADQFEMNALDDDCSMYSDALSEGSVDPMHLQWTGLPSALPAAAQIVTVATDDYVGADLSDTMTPYNWFGLALIAFERQIDGYIAEQDELCDDVSLNEYPAFGGRNGFLATEPIQSALEEFSMHEEFCICGSIEEIVVKDRLSGVDHLTVRFNDGCFSISGTDAWPWSQKYTNCAIGHADSIEAAYDDLHTFLPRLLHAVACDHEASKAIRQETYRDYVLCGLPDMIKAVQAKNIEADDMRLRVDELRRGVQFVMEDCPYAALSRLPVHVQKKLPALYEARPQTMLEKLSVLAAHLSDIPNQISSVVTARKRSPYSPPSPAENDQPTL